MGLKWPLVTRARYDREREIFHDIARYEVCAEVHAWARDASARFFYIDNYRAKGAAIAAFQQLEQQFNPKPPTTMSEGLTKPANVEEAIDAVTGPERSTAVGISAPGRDASGRGHIRPV